MPAVFRGFGLLRMVKPVVFGLCLVPALLLAHGIIVNDLGANPLETVTHETGLWSLRLLLLTLAGSPLRRLTGWNRLQSLRRMLGLYAFFYACLHFLTWVWLDQGLRWDAVLEDIAKRPYVTVGFTAFVILIPLAVTSTKSMMRRLGRRWQTLHRLVYLSAALVLVHFVWLVKADVAEPLFYAAVYFALILFRIPFVRRRIMVQSLQSSGVLSRNG